MHPKQRLTGVDHELQPPAALFVVLTALVASGCKERVADYSGKFPAA